MGGYKQERRAHTEAQRHGGVEGEELFDIFFSSSIIIILQSKLI